MRALSLRNELFLLAHDESGKLIISESVMETGLAGATLIELLLLRRIGVVDGRLDVVDPTLTSDDERDATMSAISDNTAACGPRAWVSWISPGAYGRTAAVLADAGAVRRTSARRLALLPAARFLVENPEDLVRLRSKVRYALHGRELPDAETAALCGLIRVLRLESSLLLSTPTSDLLLTLERMARGSEVTVRQVTNAVATVIAASAYR